MKIVVRLREALADGESVRVVVHGFSQQIDVKDITSSYPLVNFQDGNGSQYIVPLTNVLAMVIAQPKKPMRISPEALANV